MKTQALFFLLFIATLVFCSCGSNTNHNYGDVEVVESESSGNDSDEDFEEESDEEFSDDYGEDVTPKYEERQSSSNQSYSQPTRQRMERIQVPCTAYGCQGGTMFCTNCSGQGYYDTGYDIIKCGQCNNGRKTCMVCNGLGYTWQERLVNY